MSAEFEAAAEALYALLSVRESAYAEYRRRDLEFALERIHGEASNESRQHRDEAYRRYNNYGIEIDNLKGMIER